MTILDNQNESAELVSKQIINQAKQTFNFMVRAFNDGGDNMNPGFYKKDGDGLLYAPNAVYAPTYTLLKEEKGSYVYPIYEWYWFDDEDIAYSFFNMPKQLSEESSDVI